MMGLKSKVFFRLNHLICKINKYSINNKEIIVNLHLEILIQRLFNQEINKKNKIPICLWAINNQNRITIYYHRIPK
jgi:hypothetical protein